MMSGHVIVSALVAAIPRVNVGYRHHSLSIRSVASMLLHVGRLLGVRPQSVMRLAPACGTWPGRVATLWEVACSDALTVPLAPQLEYTTLPIPASGVQHSLHLRRVSEADFGIGSSPVD